MQDSVALAHMHELKIIPLDNFDRGSGINSIRVGRSENYVRD